MVFSFFLVFFTLLPNQVEYTWLKSQLHVCNYELAKILFVDRGLDSKLQHCGMEFVKFVEKNQKLHSWILAITLKVTSCKTMSKKKVAKKRKTKIQ
jgi:hypothetical protein